MQVAIIGTGYVGLVTGADLAARGISVTCVDVDGARIAGLQQGVMPFFEAGLSELVAQGVAAGRLTFTTDAAAAVRQADVVMSCVGTPLGEDGHADLRAVFDVAATFAAHAPSHAVLVNKSTVPVGTAAKCAAVVGDRVVSNPEFLRQGTAVHDTAHPTRIVVGATTAAAQETMRILYASFIADGVPYLAMQPASAEAVKCAANAFLATKLSFINEMANYCAKVGGNVHEVATAIGLDPRIGGEFLQAGLGYGGGCLSKDIASLIAAGQDAGYAFRILPQVEAVNEAQRFVLNEALGDARGKRIAVWGLAFKPGTDDLRHAPSLPIIRRLLADGATVVAYDPVAMPKAQHVLADVQYAPSAQDALRDADALMVLTEWPEFFVELTSLTVPIVLDGRGVFHGRKKPNGMRYIAIGCG